VASVVSAGFEAEPSLPVVGSASVRESCEVDALLGAGAFEDADDDPLQSTHSDDAVSPGFSCAGTEDEPTALGLPELFAPVEVVVTGLSAVGSPTLTPLVTLVQVAGAVDSFPSLVLVGEVQ
jgi:hypothetical protein